MPSLPTIPSSTPPSTTHNVASSSTTPSRLGMLIQPLSPGILWGGILYAVPIMLPLLAFCYLLKMLLYRVFLRTTSNSADGQSGVRSSRSGGGEEHSGANWKRPWSYLGRGRLRLPCCWRRMEAAEIPSPISAVYPPNRGTAAPEVAITASHQFLFPVSAGPLHQHRVHQAGGRIFILQRAAPANFPLSCNPEFLAADPTRVSTGEPHLWTISAANSVAAVPPSFSPPGWSEGGGVGGMTFSNPVGAVISTGRATGFWQCQEDIVEEIINSFPPKYEEAMGLAQASSSLADRGRRHGHEVGRHGRRRIRQRVAPLLVPAPILQPGGSILQQSQPHPNMLPGAVPAPSPPPLYAQVVAHPPRPIAAINVVGVGESLGSPPVYGGGCGDGCIPPMGEPEAGSTHLLTWEEALGEEEKGEAALLDMKEGENNLDVGRDDGCALSNETAELDGCVVEECSYVVGELSIAEGEAEGRAISGVVTKGNGGGLPNERPESAPLKEAGKLARGSMERRASEDGVFRMGDNNTSKEENEGDSPN